MEDFDAEETGGGGGGEFGVQRVVPGAAEGHGGDCWFAGHFFLG